MNVFVSWRGSDREIKNTIVGALREGLDESVLVWESDEDCLSNFSQECIEAIRKCDVFVVIVSDASMEPSYVINEVIEARNREMRGELNLVVYKITDSEYTPEFAANINHVSDVNRIARLAGNDEGVPSLVKRVRYLLERRKNNNPEKPYDVFEPKIEGTALSKMGYFVPNSRDEVFEEIETEFQNANVLFTAQMTGYGRKSAVRKYAEQHVQEYKQIIVLHLFHGTLREFFIDGLRITNINDSLFDKLNENEVILKKAELLSKLGKDTLLIVPNLTVDERDDAFVFDALASVSCRIIFVTQTLPTRFKNTFPVISIGRLKKEHLKEMFFHYYDIATEEEQDALEEVLYTFFDNVDGHTKSVEITAMALAEEIGVYPEDIEKILDDIHLDSENELGDRIFKLISSLFDMKNFAEDETAVLLVAALTAVQPMDEKFFVELLKECGVYQSAAVRKLSENGWIDLDRANRTISVEPLLAEVCLAKIPLDQDLLAKCIGFFCDQIETSLYLQLEINVAKAHLNRMKVLFRTLKMNSAIKLIEIFLLFVNDEEFGYEKEIIERLVEQAKGELLVWQSAQLKEALEVSIEILHTLCESLLFFSDISTRDTEESIIDAGLKSMNPSVLLDLCTSDIEEAPLGKFLHHFIEVIGSNQGNKVIGMYLMFCEHLEEIVGSVDEDEEVLLDLVGNIGVNLRSYQSSDYLKYKLCRAHIKLRMYAGGFASYTDLCGTYKEYTYSMLACKCYTEELTEAFETTLHWMNKERKVIFEDDHTADISINQFICEYALALADDVDASEAEEIYQRTDEISRLDDDIVAARMSAIEKIANAYIRAGEIAAAVSFLQSAFTKELVRYLETNPELEEERNTWEYLEMVLDSFVNAKTEHEFTDASEEYFDYYKSFASGLSDKFLLTKYFRIAEQAQSLDYSALTDEELAAQTEKLKEVASRTGKWEKLAPEAFALVSEAGSRVLGYKHHYVQYVGAAAMMDGKIAEIQNGEGKTYTIILTAYLHVLFGRQVHIIDAYEYLTERNYTWMRGVLEVLGCKVGLLNDSHATSEVAEELKNSHVIYASRDALIFWKEWEEIGIQAYTLRYEAAIVDEADYLLLVEGATPITTVRSERGKKEGFIKFAWWPLLYEFLCELSKGDVHLFEEKDGSIYLKPELYERLDEQIQFMSANPTTEEMNELEGLLRVGIRVLFFYERGRDYHIVDGKILFENEFLGTFSEGSSEYRYFIARKEHLKESTPVRKERRCVQNYYTTLGFMTNYEFLSGTTATASSMQKEFKELYNLQVICIPTNRPIARINYMPTVFSGKKGKEQYILQLVQEKYEAGQPVLVITGSVEESERMHRLLRSKGIDNTLLNAKNQEEEDRLLGNAGRFRTVTVTTALANRGVDILLGGNPFKMAKQHLLDAGIDRELLNDAIYRSKITGEATAEVRNKYDSLVSYYKGITAQDKELVEALGGLCVIGTKCFDSLAVEQQVRGRAGRQGAVGESHICYSLEDKSIKTLLGSRGDTICAMLSIEEEEEIGAGILVKAIFNARKNVQNMTYKRLNNIPDMLYYRFARKEILEPLELFKKGQVTWNDLVERYYIKNQEMRDAYLQATIAKLEEIGLGIAECGEFLFKNEVRNAWEEYLKQMEAELVNARIVFNGREKRERKHLTDFSNHCSRKLMEEAVEKTIRRYLASKRSE